MAKSDTAAAVTPEQCIAGLPELPLETADKETDDGLRRAELRQSLLAVAEMNHVSETALVQAVIENALGRLPEFDEEP